MAAMISPDPKTPSTDASLLEAQWGFLRGSQLSERKILAKRRLDILTGNFEPQVVDHVYRTHASPEIKKLITPHVSVGVNAAEDITGALAVVYKQGVVRTLTKGSKGKKDALESMFDEACMSTLCPTLNRLGFFVGPTLEVPNMRGDRKSSDVFTTEKVDVVQDPDDPLGQPIKAAYPWWDPSHGDVIVILDSEKWAYYAEGRDKPYKVVEHGIGEFPGTLWRGDKPLDPRDYWVSNRNARLSRVTVEIAFINTLMDWVRKDQNRHILSLFGNLGKLPKQQIIEPGVPWVMDVDNEDANPEFKVTPGAVDPQYFIAQMMFKFRNVAESYGVPQSAVTFDFEGNQPASMMAITHERLSSLRNAQVPFYREAEMSSAWKGVAIAHALGHPHASKLPSADEVKDKFILHVPELNRVDDPKEGREQHDWEKARGLASDVDLVLRKVPGLTRDEAIEWIRQRHEEQADINDLVTKRNLSLDPNGAVEGAAQAFGRTGPMQRDAGKPAPPGPDAPPE